LAAARIGHPIDTTNNSTTALPSSVIGGACDRRFGAAEPAEGGGVVGAVGEVGVVVVVVVTAGVGGTHSWGEDHPVVSP